MSKKFKPEEFKPGKFKPRRRKPAKLRRCGCGIPTFNPSGVCGSCARKG